MQVRVANVLSDLALEVCEIFHGLRGPFILDQLQEHRRDRPCFNSFELDAYLPRLEFIAQPAITAPFGAISPKPSSLVHFLCPLADVQSCRCSHPKQWRCRRNHRGQRMAFFVAHLLLGGTEGRSGLSVGDRGTFPASPVQVPEW